MIDPIVLAKYEKPIEHIDHDTRVYFRVKAIRRALFWILLGLGAAIIVIMLDIHGIGSQSGRRDGAGSILALVVVCAPIYGVLQLLTLKSRMLDLARTNIIAANPELNPIEAQRKQNLEIARSRFLKVFTFTFAGTLIALSIVFAIYATLNY